LVIGGSAFCKIYKMGGGFKELVLENIESIHRKRASIIEQRGKKEKFISIFRLISDVPFELLCVFFFQYLTLFSLAFFG